MSLVILAAAAEADALTDADQEFLARVGAILRQRTILRDTGGRELGTFTDQTRPTATQVLELRDDQAREDLEASLGDLDALARELPELANDIESLLALGTALQVELTYFAGDVSARRSPYDQLEKRYDKRVAAVLAKVGRLRDGDPEVADPTPAPVYSFPPAPCYDDGPYYRDPRRW